jgi:Tol biopolymer transport system component
MCGVVAIDPASGDKTTLVAPPEGCEPGGDVGLLGYEIAASQTGKYLAFAVSRICGGCGSEPTAETLAATGIWVVDTTTGELTREAECQDGFCGRVAISPDGERLAYTTTTNPELVIQHVDGSAPVRISLDAAGFDPHFSADGQHVRVHGDGKVTQYPADGIGDPVTMANSIPGAMEFSPDGKHAVGSDNEGAIYLADADLTNPRIIDYVDPRSNAASAWSPDSKSFAYSQSVPTTTDAHAVQEQIRVASLDGSTRVVFLSAPIASRFPYLSPIAYSPDSHQIAFTIEAGDEGASGVYVIDAQGGEPHKADGFGPDMGSGDWISWASRP